MGNPPRALAFRQLRFSAFWFIPILLVIGWGRAAEVPSIEEGENDSLAMEDPGSQDRIVRRIHPKSPPPPRQEDIPPTSTLFSLELEDGLWYVTIEDDASNSEVSCQTNCCQQTRYVV